MAFSWLEDVPVELQKRLRQDVLDLQKNCRLDGQKYITSILAGTGTKGAVASDVCSSIKVFSDESNIFHPSTSSSSSFLARNTVIISSGTTRYAKNLPLS